MPATLPRLAGLNTTAARAYVGSRALFEHLVKHGGLKPVYKGEGHKTIIYRTDAIDTALAALQINGGWDEENDRPIKEQH